MTAEDDSIRVAAEYDRLGDAYAASSVEHHYNALYERPAMFELAGDVRGLHVLDAGCAAGALTSELVAHGATVVGVDVSSRMVAAARARLGDRASFVIADLSKPLTGVADATFDVVTASLVLHYLRDWTVPLSEFNRLLRPGGLLVFSTHHPAATFTASPIGDYFATELLNDEWEKGGSRFEVHYYRRPLQAVLQPLLETGYAIERVLEPRPLDAMAERHPNDWAKLRTEPWFLVVSARSSSALRRSDETGRPPDGSQE